MLNKGVNEFWDMSLSILFFPGFSFLQIFSYIYNFH